MLIELILALILGIFFGVLTGLTPGIHINLISVLLLASSALLLEFVSPLTLVIFIVAMSMTHTFVDFIPSVFLGAPNEDTGLSILPGHQLLLEGQGYAAVILTLYGGISALLIILFFIPFFIYLLPLFYPYAMRIMWIILILIAGYFIFSEKTKRLWALIIFILAGFLGIASLNLDLKEPLLPLFTGLFGASSLIISIIQKTKIPPQKIFPLSSIRLNQISFAKAILASLIASPFTAFLPGLGASQAAIIGSQVTEIKDQKEFLFLLGAINTIVMGLSFVALYSIQKTRTGSAVAVSRLIETLTLTNLGYIIATIILSGFLAFIISILITKLIAKNIHKIAYHKVSIVILSILGAAVIYFTGIVGVLIFITATALGITTIILEIKRTYLMGCLLIPTILIYLF